jgi:hypothetical protein
MFRGKARFFYNFGFSVLQKRKLIINRLYDGSNYVNE